MELNEPAGRTKKLNKLVLYNQIYSYKLFSGFSENSFPDIIDTLQSWTDIAQIPSLFICKFVTSNYTKWKSVTYSIENYCVCNSGSFNTCFLIFKEWQWLKHATISCFSCCYWLTNYFVKLYLETAPNFLCSMF